ncbi:MAG: Flp pilus assembly complex ATPase component TadA, partial [Candidatus Hydrogenedentes bacterium]|nr:Flp pilus assembly complex ATPase component TadA [Candidatus Hydrogenedentota bacterium]
SGKTTTLATMLDYLNTEFDVHIITIEDPIEYYHSHKRGIINQREVGVDVPTFAEAIRRALRMDPDIILVGEMRDLETIEAAITAAETGHLVFATLHTTGAVRTIDRIVDAFPSNQQEQIRTQLAGNLKCVVSQVILPRKSGFGRVAGFEIMISTPAIQNLIRENKSFRITSAIQTGHKYGMNLLDEHLLALYRKGIVKYEDAVGRAQSADEFAANAKAVGMEGQPPPAAA